MPTLSSQRRWVYTRPGRSGRGSPGRWISGRGVSMRYWWGMTRHKGPPGKEETPALGRRRTRRYPKATMTRCCMVSFSRLSARPPTGRGEGVSSQITNVPKPGGRLQRSSGRITQTCVPPPWKIPHAQLSRSTERCRKHYPSTSQRMSSRGSYQRFPAQQVRWEQRQLS